MRGVLAEAARAVAVVAKRSEDGQWRRIGPVVFPGGRCCVTRVRRRSLALGASCEGRTAAVIADRPNDIRILEVRHEFEDFQYRAPYQFGGRSVDRVTLLNVTCRVRTNGGRESCGFGSMTLGNAWAFPAASQDAGLGAMRTLAGDPARRHRRTATTRAIRSISSACSNRSTCEPQPTSRAAQALPVPIPKLCTLVVASAFDAAIHDAYGKAFGAELSTKPTVRSS